VLCYLSQEILWLLIVRVDGGSFAVTSRARVDRVSIWGLIPITESACPARLTKRYVTMLPAAGIERARGHDRAVLRCDHRENMITTDKNITRRDSRRVLAGIITTTSHVLLVI